MPSRAAFEQILRAADPAQPLALSVRTYVPAFDVPGDIVQRLRHARTASGAPEAGAKVIVRRMAAPRPPAAATPGKRRHPARRSAARKWRPRGYPPPSRWSRACRSAARSSSRPRSRSGHLVRALGDDDRLGPFRWQDEYAALMAGRPFTPERLTAIAARYDLPTGARTRSAGGRVGRGSFPAGHQARAYAGARAEPAGTDPGVRRARRVGNRAENRRSLMTHHRALHRHRRVAP